MDKLKIKRGRKRQEQPPRLTLAGSLNEPKPTSPDTMVVGSLQPVDLRVIGVRAGSAILLFNGPTTANKPYPTPTVVGHYLQEVFPNVRWKQKSPYVENEERSPGVHLSGVIKLLMRRMSGTFALDEALPERVTLGMAFERQWMGYPWHSGTVYQPGPIELESIHMTPDGITKLPDPYLTGLYPNICENHLPWMIEELKLTYYSSKRADSIISAVEFQGWMHQIAGYVLGTYCMFASTGTYAGLTNRFKPNIEKDRVLSRLTVCWVNDSYSFGKSTPGVIEKTPKYEVWVFSWSVKEILEWWSTHVLKFRDEATPEKGTI